MTMTQVPDKMAPEFYIVRDMACDRDPVVAMTEQEAQSILTSLTDANPDIVYVLCQVTVLGSYVNVTTRLQ